ncbi:MAG TPA: putative metal-binding motif-containing protein [Archangium sp.]|jgi:hypothetical protein|uniref:putative metal-binding motif-containing protein n=1 Tax=Archangium sp. TaxID=1872627 RepID=UPI002ED82B5C
MLQRLVLLIGLLTLIGCQKGHEGAVKLTVSYSGFKPGCIRVGVKDEGGAGEERTTQLEGKGAVTGGSVTVAAFREAGWGPSLLLTAQAFEVECTGSPVSTATGVVKVDKAAVTELELKLSGTDADQDGYVARDTGGHDCDDRRGEAHPGARELCNGRDDNCDERPDEGLEVGALCDTTDGCKGAWTCDAQGARTCVARPDQWRRDSDGDGQGDPKSTSQTSCKQPTGYVPNDLDCDDTNKRRYTGATELCNTVDDDCDATADEGLGVGNACTGAGGCGGKLACNAADAGVLCNSPTPVVLYPDNDQDTRGAADAGVSSCEPTRPGHVTNANDCDDTRANVYMSAPEICDSQDNDCDGTTDESFNVGAGCDPGLGCTGARACAADGGTRCDYVTPPTSYYPDDDLDQHGRADAGVLTCAPNPGHVPQAGDCDDGNPFAHGDMGELCDQADNDCDGTEDEDGVCPTGGATWVDRSTANTDDWRSVTVWGDGGVWLTGLGSRLRHRAPGQTTFQNFDARCAGDWYGLWADPQSGTAYLGGLNQLSAYHGAAATSCTPGLTITNTDVHGIVGVPQTGGGTEFHFVGFSRGNANEGRAMWWDGSALNSGDTTLGPLWDVHGVSRDVLFAVGGFQPTTRDPGEPRIYRFKPAQDDWQTEFVQNLSGVVEDQLQGVWVVNPKLAYAVGESNSVLRWNGTAWSKHSGPGGDLYSVVAFGTSSVYVTTGNGRVYRYDGSAWSALPGLNTGAPLWDIAGTSPADLWVVGDNGKLLHWPR